MTLDTHESPTEYVYSVYGLTLRSNQPIAALVPSTAASAPSLFVNFVGDSPASTAECDQQPIYSHIDPSIQYRVTALADGGRRLFFETLGVYIELLIPGSGDEIRVACSAQLSLEDLYPFILGVGIATLLIVRGMLVLHGSVLKCDQQAILLVGHSGAGKSTSTTALMRAGCALLSDDLAPLIEQEGGFFVPPGFPRIRLRHDAAGLFYPAIDALPLLWSSLPQGDVNKHYVDFETEDAPFWNSPLPISTIYVLAARKATLTTPIITPLTGIESLVQLAANTYARYLLDQTRRDKQMAVFQRLLNGVRVCRVERPNGLEYLPEITQAILDDARRYAA